MSIQPTSHARGGSSMGRSMVATTRWCADTDAHGQPLDYRLREDYRSLMATQVTSELSKRNKRKKKASKPRVRNLAVVTIIG